MRHHVDGPVARASSRILRLRRAFRVVAETPAVASPPVFHLVADDEVDGASTVASSEAWRARATRR